MMKNESYILKTLGRGLEVLAALKNSPRHMTLSELGSQLDESPAVVFRILKTLEAYDYIRQDAAGKGYGLASEALAINASTHLMVGLLRVLSERYPEAVPSNFLLTRFDVGGQELSELLLSLKTERLVEESSDGYWCLAHGCLELAAPLLGHDDVFGRIGPTMEQLRDETKETISLFHITGEQQIVSASLPSRQPIRYVLGVGKSFPLYLGAAGKSALSSMTKEEVERYLDMVELVPSTDFIPDRKSLLQELGEIRHRGYALSVSERVEGAASVAAPLYDRNNRLAAVLSIVMPAYRNTQARLNGMGVLLMRKAKEAGFATKPRQ